MDKKHNISLSRISCALLSVVVSSQVLAASNLTISPTPGTTIPTTIYPGSTVYAFYTVTNNTKSALSNYSLQGLPATVKQNTTYSGYCSNPVNLAAHASCIMELDITGETISNFALCRGSSCTTATTPLYVLRATTPLPLVAPGAYDYQAGKLFTAPAPVSRRIGYPLVATSFNNGLSWLYTLSNNTAQVPGGMSEGALNSAHCVGTMCIASGAYINSAGLTYPLIASSTNGGVNWTYPVSSSPALPTGVSQAQFATSSCYGNTCIAVGGYQFGQTPFPALKQSPTPLATFRLGYPLLAVSTNTGINWSYVMPGALAAPSNGALFTGASCSSKSCVASGSYSDIDGVVYPLLIITTDKGAHWSYKIAKSYPQLPSDFDINPNSRGGNFNDSSCSGYFCAAAGSYTALNASGNQIIYPLLASSSDGGTSWSYTITSSNLPPNFNSTGAVPNPFPSGHFNSASCSGMNCVAAGSYNVYNPSADITIQYPMLASSLNGGISWTYPINNGNPPPNFDADASHFPPGGQFNSVSCNGNICIGVGSYFVYESSAGQDVSYPFLALSTDSGAHWSYKITNTMPQLPNDFDMNGGGYFDNAYCNGSACIASGAYFTTGRTQSALLASSNDGGITWVYTVSSNNPPLPIGTTYQNSRFMGKSNLTTKVFALNAKNRELK
ncbi:TPA: hypothetical protein ACPSKY_003174 [Legionella bozemanae]